MYVPCELHVCGLKMPFVFCFLGNFRLPGHSSKCLGGRHEDIEECQLRARVLIDEEVVRAYPKL